MIKGSVLAPPVLAVAALAWFASTTLRGRDPDEIRAEAPTMSDAQAAVWAECEVLYRNASLAEIEIELEGLGDAIRVDAKPYYEARFAAGAFEVEGFYEPGVPYEVQPDLGVLSARRMMPDGVVGIVVLPRNEFPETYELLYRGQWLARKKQILSILDRDPAGAPDPSQE